MHHSRLRLVPGSIALVLSISSLHAATEPVALPEAAIQLSGESARQYLEENSEGSSLMQALNDVRFALRRTDCGADYLAVSHDQNVTALFAKEGVTVRPTGPEQEGARPWQLALRLKALGYGPRISAPPPIVSQEVKGARITYQRRQKAKRGNAQIAEWYENRSEGIEQGFTLPKRPRRGRNVSAHEPLRLVLRVSGGLSAAPKENGRALELRDRLGVRALDYSGLVAVDAAGKQLPSRMEASADGREIALIVDDRAAKYPLTIDPLIATQEAKLDASGNRQTDARFGFSVAIVGNTAIVGAWREDIPFTALLDAGGVYFFTRSGSVWGGATLLAQGEEAGASCGWSVALTYHSELGNIEFAYGCPGTANGGRAYVMRDVGFGYQRTQVLDPTASGDRYGESIAITDELLVVGAPRRGATDAGAVHIRDVDFQGIPSFLQTINGTTPGGEFGTSVAVNDRTVVVGAPLEDPAGLTDAGVVRIYTREGNSGFLNIAQTLTASDAAAGDNFGNSVALVPNTAVVGAPGDDDLGADAGAAYIFVRDASAVWAEQQKIEAADGRAGDRFSEHAVAVEGSTVVVGAFAHDLNASNLNDNRGAAYVFTRDNTVWRQEAQLLSNDLVAADSFGIGVGISGNSIIVGARAAASAGVARSGAAYVFRLDCLAPSNAVAFFNTTGFPSALTACLGSNVILQTQSQGTNLSYQWRKAGVNIPGATSVTYPINNVRVPDLSSYDVVVSNACGSITSNPITLSTYTYNISPMSQTFAQSGGKGAVNTTSSGPCGGQGNSNVSWITITSTFGGNGSGVVVYSVAPNPEAVVRTGTLSIVGRTFTVTQQAAPPAATFTVTTTDEHNDGSCDAADCSLWDAVTAANALTYNSIISFAPGVTGLITTALNNTGIPVTGPITLIGPGARSLTISGSNTGRIFNVASSAGIVRLSGLTLANGKTPGSGSPAGYGGAIFNEALLSLTDCTITGSMANTFGGAVYNNGANGNARLTLTNCTVDANSALSGGAIFAGGYNGQSTVELTNCTFDSNVATQFGGAIYSDGTSSGNAAVSLTNCTFNQNSAGTVGATFVLDAMNPGSAGTSTLLLRNTILRKGASGANFFNDGGSITSQGNNLSNDAAGGAAGTAPGGFLNATGDQRNTDPQLDVLAKNGGPTNTAALLSGSPAIDVGNDALAPAQDQRGYTRAAVSDIGAFEFGGTVASPPTVVSAVSRKVHGASGTFDINLPLQGSAGIECRTGGAGGNHQVVVTFASAVSVGGVSITSRDGQASATQSVSGAVVTVDLSAVANAQTLGITLSGVSNGSAVANIFLPMAILVGDTTGNGSATATDVGQVKSQSGQAVTATNFRTDVTANGGSISASDIGLVKSASGSQLP